MIKGIVIKGMEMPENCRDCPCIQPLVFDTPICKAASEFLYNDIWTTRPDWCPLIETEIEDEDLAMQIIKDRLLRQERIREIYDE